MRIVILTLSMLLALGTAAEAQYDFGFLTWDVECVDGGATTIAVRLEIGEDFGGRVHEIRVTRSTVGECDSSFVLESDTVGPLDPGEYEYEYVDPDPVGRMPFSYVVTLHDEHGEDLRVSNFFMISKFIDVASCGDPIIGHGYLVSPENASVFGASRSDYWSPRLHACAGACWPRVPVGNYQDAHVQPYVDSGVPVLLMGEFWCGDIISGCALRVTAVYEIDCQEPSTPAEVQSWGSLKARF